MVTELKRGGRRGKSVRQYVDSEPMEQLESVYSKGMSIDNHIPLDRRQLKVQQPERYTNATCWSIVPTKGAVGILIVLA